MTVNGVVSTMFLASGLFSFVLAREGFGIFNAVISVLLGGAGLLNMIPKGDDDYWEYTMEEPETNPSGARESMPQAILDMDDSLLSHSIEPALRQFLKTWL